MNRLSLFPARIIALHATGNATHATLIAGDRQWEEAWPQNGPPAILGAVYQVSAAPFTVHAVLTTDTPVQPWQAADAMRWRIADAHGLTRMALLQRRHTIKRVIRDYLDAQGFIEIDMPLMVRGTTPDTGIQTFAAENGRQLVTSTEYQIKRMEIGGFERLYTLTQNFRQEETLGHANRFRNPEFTMLEWARVGQSLEVIESDIEQMVLLAAHAVGVGSALPYQDHTIDLSPPWDRLSVADAIGRATGFTPPDFTLGSLHKALAAAQIPLQPEWANDVTFVFSVLLDHIQPNLGLIKPVFLQDWPAFLTASAENTAMPERAVRSEAFIAGIELSDGFPTLTSPIRQNAAFAAQQTRRLEENLPPAPLDHLFLKAMDEGLPSGAGMAMGFDRLVMLLTNQTHIRRVLAFHWDEL